MIAALALLLAAQTVAAPPPTPAASPAPAASPTPALPRVAIVTSAGRIVVEADTQHAPVTAKNFLHYVDTRRLDGMTFYRAVRAAPDFGFVQFGVQGRSGRVFPPIAHEPTTTTGLRHVDGTLSTTRWAPGSARGDFTISVGDQPSLDAHPDQPGDNQGFAAFGHVVEGMDVVHTILDAPADSTKGEGVMKGSILAAPITIVSARRIAPSPRP